MSIQTQSAPLASLICPGCRKFFTVPQSDRGTVVTCRFCAARVCVPETRQQVARLAIAGPEEGR